MASMKEPLITTIIPTYRRPELLRKAIQSVLNQTFPHFLIYVCDNASGDETASDVSEFSRGDSRVKYFCHSRNIEAIPNFNFGMRQVKTPFFSLLADDNTLLPDFFKDAIEALESNPEAVLFAGQTIKIDDKGQIISSSLVKWPSGPVFPPDGLINIWEKRLPTWESVLFRTEILKTVGFLDPSLNPSTDQDFMMRITRKYMIYISKKPYAIFLRHEQSWGFNRQLMGVVSSRKKMAERYLHDEGLSDSVRNRIRKAYVKLIRKSINNELYKHGIMKNNSSVIREAASILKNEFGFSFKARRAIFVAKLAQQHEILRKFILSYTSRYVQTKRKVFNLLTKLRIKKYLN